MKVYLASSWRNARQPAILAALREAGHEVYDFRNPAPGDNGFGWKQCDPRPPSEWSVEDYLRVLQSPAAQRGFKFDMDALRGCDAAVLVLPCGRSAHLELGWAAGAGRRTIALCEKLDEPELMYLMCERVCATVAEVIAALAAAPSAAIPAPAAAALETLPPYPPQNLMRLLTAEEEHTRAVYARRRCEALQSLYLQMLTAIDSAGMTALGNHARQLHMAIPGPEGQPPQATATTPTKGDSHG